MVVNVVHRCLFLWAHPSSGTSLDSPLLKIICLPFRKLVKFNDKHWPTDGSSISSKRFCPNESCTRFICVCMLFNSIGRMMFINVVQHEHLGQNVYQLMEFRQKNLVV